VQVQLLNEANEAIDPREVLSLGDAEALPATLTTPDSTSQEVMLSLDPETSTLNADITDATNEAGAYSLQLTVPPESVQPGYTFDTSAVEVQFTRQDTALLADAWVWRGGLIAVLLLILAIVALLWSAPTGEISLATATGRAISAPTPLGLRHLFRTVSDEELERAGIGRIAVRKSWGDKAIHMKVFGLDGEILHEETVRSGESASGIFAGNQSRSIRYD
jgi:hypothetical protein